MNGIRPIGDLESSYTHIVGKIIRVGAQKRFMPPYSGLDESMYPAMHAIKCATASAAQPKLAM